MPQSMALLPRDFLANIEYPAVFNGHFCRIVDIVDRTDAGSTRRRFAGLLLSATRRIADAVTTWSDIDRIKSALPTAISDASTETPLPRVN